jgi:adenosylmethionine-8-amino-7-oxononanoate aminotransferase
MSTAQHAIPPNTPELLRDAFAHCIFPLVPTADVYRDGPTVFAEGSGASLVDINGKTYLDMMGSHTRANSLGYGNDEVARAMYEQARRLHYVGTANYLSEPMVRLATKVAELAPGRLSKVVFVSGGSEAVETALKIAKQYQQNGPKPRAYKIISRWNAYHGATMGALSVTDWLAVRDVFDPRLPGHSFVANPSRYRNPYGMENDEEYAELCTKHLERQIQFEGPDLVAAFIGEPIMQANGVQIPPKAYWQRVREICTKYGVMMIVDEVITGFGRTGHWFASEYFGIEPDIMTMAKAITGGYAPMGAVITRDEIADGIPMFRHVHTFSGHATGCAAANAVIAIKQREGLVPRAKANGEYFLAALKAAVATHPIVGDVRGIGHWHAVDFTADRKTRAPFTDDTVKAVVHRMADLGVIAGVMGSALEMAPPLIVMRADLDRAVEVCAQAIEQTAKERGLV